MTLVFAAATGGVYAYWTEKPGAQKPLKTAVIAKVPEEKPVTQTFSKKLIQDRLLPPEPETPAASPAVLAENTQPQDAQKGAIVHSGAPEARKLNEEASTPAVSPQAGGEKLVSDAPTIVRSERYSPDGARTDLPAAPLAASAKLAAFESNNEPAAIPVMQAEPQPGSPEERGYFAQIRSDQNQKTAEADAADVAEKYKAVLGEVPLKARQADLKEKGIWFRVLAGPLRTYGDAESLCKKMKKAGFKACIVQKLD